MDFTKQQQQVIESRNQNLLVSAAAGSGKTAVLVERILRIIMEGADVDRLLVVTFTEAAAAEMRERLSRILSETLISEPENQHLRKQTILIHNAQITTIHGFCLQVLKNHFQDISLEPGFRVADEGEIKLLSHDVMENLLEECYREKNEDFIAFVERYAKAGDTEMLSEMILKLFSDGMSHPFFEERMHECEKNLVLHDLDELENAVWMKYIYSYENAILHDCLNIINQAVRLCNDVNGPKPYEEALLDDRDYINLVLQKTTYRERSAVIQSWKMATLSRKKCENVDEVIRENVKDLRAAVKKSINDLKKSFYPEAPERVLKYQNLSGDTVKVAVELALRFEKCFEQIKRDKNIIDFSDMEHLALKILVSKEDGNVILTEAAKEYREFFTEVMVDEYQDSNEVQELLLWAVSREDGEKNNRFMVGDVKQSIYKFRLARPEIFMEKYDRYEENGKHNRKIILSKNFRSREEVLESTNYVFERLMTRDLGNIEYDKDARLYYGASFAEAENENFHTELLMFEKASGGVEEEAAMVAGRILELLETAYVTDKSTKQLRKVQLRDIVILLRTVKDVDEVFKNVLQKYGIPAYITSRSGYFATVEIGTILDYIELLVNPRRDLPLHSVMTSVLGGFCENEIIQIRVNSGTGVCLFDSLMEAVSDDDFDPVLKGKVQYFLDELDEYRKSSAYLPVYRLIERIFLEKRYLIHMSAMPGGEQRKANLSKLSEYAKKFENTSFSGLFDFLRYVQLLQKREVDLGEANIVDENANVVKIMTIHKSKGLEFPICFVSMLGKKFSAGEYRETLLTDSEIGLGNKYIDLENRYQTDTLRRNAIICKHKAENRGEDLRILYVAMTRAKEKLILTGRVGNLEKSFIDAYSSFQIRINHLSFTERVNASSFMDMLLPVFAGQSSFKESYREVTGQLCGGLQAQSGKADIDIKIYKAEDLTEVDISQSLSKALLRERLHDNRNLEESEFWQDKFSFIYPHKNLEGLFTKTTVSELKHAAYEQAVADERNESVQLLEEESDPYIPDFVSQKEQIGGTNRGTAYHRMMELLDFAHISDRPEQFYKDQKQRVLLNKRMKEEEVNLIFPDKITGFLKSDLAWRMKKAHQNGMLFREQPFVLGVPAKLLNEDFPEEESVLIQGVIDVYFEEDNELVLLDYKTDRVQNANDLVKRYQSQLIYYTIALERLTGKKVRDKLIYSFCLDEVIKVD